MTRPTPSPWLGREWPAIAAITMLAAIVRFVGFGQLGLDHFDEGIYAATATWSLQPSGLAGLDPGLIYYAPPGYPILVGVAYALIGASDLAAIAVSILAGLAAIPVAGWLGRRTLGPGGGVAVAALACVSGLHVVFSRMALTDATLILLWLVGMGVGGGFLERPNPARAIALGLTVGLAQLVKYNGWLIGAIVAATALLGPLLVRIERDRSRLIRLLGWGMLAALIAGLVYTPWYRFVMARVGYGSLLAHQRGYLGTIGDWPRHLRTQLEQAVSLSGGERWGASAVGLAFVATALILGNGRLALRQSWPMLAALGMAVVFLGPATSGWWLGIGLAPIFLLHPAPRVRLLGAWWLVLWVLTPLYHPYARLWLPLEAAGWLLRGWAIVLAVRWGSGTATGSLTSWIGGRVLPRIVIAAGLAAARIQTNLIPPVPLPLGGLTGPRDSFRRATYRVLAAVPSDVGLVRWLARPELSFYAANAAGSRRLGMARVGGLADLLKPGEGWAIVDTVMLRQEGDGARARLLERWSIVAEETMTLSPATLLDYDPSAALGDLSSRSQSLLLLRPNRPRPIP